VNGGVGRSRALQTMAATSRPSSPEDLACRCLLGFTRVETWSLDAPYGWITDESFPSPAPARRCAGSLEKLVSPPAGCRSTTAGSTRRRWRRRGRSGAGSAGPARHADALSSGRSRKDAGGAVTLRDLGELPSKSKHRCSSKDRVRRTTLDCHRPARNLRQPRLTPVGAAPWPSPGHRDTSNPPGARRGRTAASRRPTRHRRTGAVILRCMPVLAGRTRPGPLP
jgi:hypothetical protein